MLEETQKNTLLGLQWDHNWNCQEVWSSYLHFSKNSRWSIPGGANLAPPPGSDRVKEQTVTCQFDANCSFEQDVTMQSVSFE